IVAADIPFFKLSNDSFKRFVEHYTEEHIPDQTTLRKINLPRLYEEILIKIRKDLCEEKIWVSIDETTDSKGNILVISVVILRKRMRNPTNILLMNLAFADLSVSIFCIFQNLSLYLSSEWPLDDLMCKMYHFVQSLSYTTSILTLVMISIERYLVIVFPLHAKNMLHKRKLMYALIAIWLCSILCCSPRLWMFGTVTVPTGPEEEVVACIIKYHLYNPKIYHIVNFIALFLVPITVMTVIYSIVYCRLNDSEKSFKRLSRSGTSSTIRSKIEVDNESTQIPLSARKTDSRNKDPESNKRNCVRLAKSGELSIEKRRKLTILLIAIVVGFFICNFPLHCRKLIQDWYPNYDGTTDAAIIATIATNLLLFFNSGLNPLLYALLSQNFRENMAQILCFRRN
ncbi:uncharacterized protein B4U79_07517, partial [Dinothrombium tinctorium]